MTRAFMQEAGKKVKVDMILTDPWADNVRYTKAVEADIIVMGWAKSIDDKSKSNALVGLCYVNEKVINTYYCSDPNKAYDWGKYHGVPKKIVDQILSRELKIIKVNRHHYNRPCKRRYEIENEPWQFCGLHKGEKNPPACCCDYPEDCKDWL